MCISTGPLTLQALLSATFPVVRRLNRKTKECINIYTILVILSRDLDIRLKMNQVSIFRSVLLSSSLSSSNSKGGRFG